VAEYPKVFRRDNENPQIFSSLGFSLGLWMRAETVKTVVSAITYPTGIDTDRQRIIAAEYFPETILARNYLRKKAASHLTGGLIQQ
jgi:hypothetical protein